MSPRTTSHRPRQACQVKPILQEICKSCKYFSGKTCKICIKSCKTCTKNEAFLARIENFALILQELARKNCKISFLPDFNHILQFFLASTCKISARFFNSCKKSFIFSARLARFLQDLAQDLATCKKNACKTCIFLAR